MDRIIIQFGRSKIILSLIIMIGLVAGYMSYSQADDPTVGVISNQPAIKAGDLEYFNNFNVDFSILDDPRYKDLEIFGENPVDAGIIGERKNPFAPL